VVNSGNDKFGLNLITCFYAKEIHLFHSLTTLKTNKKTLFLFGLSGVGKSYLANYLAINHGFHSYEADDDLTPAMKEAIQNKTHFTDKMRDEFFELITVKIFELQKSHEKIVVSQGLYKNKHRKYLIQKIPNLELIWVKASNQVLVERIKAQGRSDITLEYAKSISANFEEPEIGMGVREVVNE